MDNPFDEFAEQMRAEARAKAEEEQREIERHTRLVQMQQQYYDSLNSIRWVGSIRPHRNRGSFPTESGGGAAKVLPGAKDSLYVAGAVVETNLGPSAALTHGDYRLSNGMDQGESDLVKHDLHHCPLTSVAAY